MTKDPGEGNPEKEGGDQAMNQGKPGISLSAEIGVETEYETDHDAVEAVTAQVAGRETDNGVVVGKDRDQALGGKLGIDAERESEQQSHPDPNS